MNLRSIAGHTVRLTMLYVLPADSSIISHARFSHTQGVEAGHQTCLYRDSKIPLGQLPLVIRHRIHLPLDSTIGAGACHWHRPRVRHWHEPLCREPDRQSRGGRYGWLAKPDGVQESNLHTGDSVGFLSVWLRGLLRCLCSCCYYIETGCPE